MKQERIDKMRLAESDFIQRESGYHKGTISFTLSCSESDGEKTIHLDLRSDRPYGHILPASIGPLIEWLKRADKWSKKI